MKNNFICGSKNRVISVALDIKKSTLAMLEQSKQLVDNTQAYIGEFQSNAMASYSRLELLRF